MRWDASAPYQELCDTTGHGQSSIFHPQEDVGRYAGKWRSIIRWRSAYVVLTMGRIPRETANHQYKCATHCESSEDTPVRTAVWTHIIPDRVMSYDLLLGRDSWDHFAVRKYKDTTKTRRLSHLQHKMKSRLLVIIVSRNGLIRLSE